MSTTERTEGPWRVEREITGFWFVRDAEGSSIVNAGMGDRSEANARIIASAPALEAQVAALTEALAEVTGDFLELCMFDLASGDRRCMLCDAPEGTPHNPNDKCGRATTALERAAATEEGGND